MNSSDSATDAGRWPGIARLEPVPLREVWRHEAHDFTVWLEENLDVVGDLVGVNLVDVQREHAAGAFSVDLLAVDDRERTVVIENQLEKSDHDHLGKLVTYLAVHEAQIAIWIVRDPRPEHVDAVNWLNRARGADFYLLKIEAFRIGDSPAAPLLTLITGPSETLKEAGSQQRELAERHVDRKRFWAGLLDTATGSHTHSGVSPSSDNWLDAGTGISGVVFHYRVRKDSADVGVLFQTGDKARNERLFDLLALRRDAIEGQFGAPMVWDRKPDVKKCEVRARSWDHGLDDEDRWTELQIAMTEAMARLAAAIRPAIAEIARESREDVAK